MGYVCERRCTSVLTLYHHITLTLNFLFSNLKIITKMTKKEIKQALCYAIDNCDNTDLLRDNLMFEIRRGPKNDVQINISAIYINEERIVQTQISMLATSLSNIKTVRL